jgi:2-polyprenyl-6-methoxyphenol hydroxylase-like FAD-dependent oxidoreductase
LEQRIDKVFAELLPDRREYKVVAFSPYRMHQRVTDRMYQGRVILVGDAAHVTNPTGGLGLTGGMFDSFALVEALSRIINEGVSHDILDYYDRDRRQKFIELVSPQATRNLENLYHLLPGQRRDEWISKTREIAGNRDDMRRALLFHEQMRTNYKDYDGI